MAEDFLHKKLDERKKTDSLRKIRLPEGGIDFCSNDYLGIVRNGLLQKKIESFGKISHGSTGSRLLTGNYRLIEEAEEMLSKFHNSEAALIFNSGYDANVGLISSIARKGDTIIYDQLSHASIRDGVRLSFANSFSFLHNDIIDLRKKLQQAAGEVFVVTESVFSMDGHICPLKEIIDLCNEFGAHLVIDEAHATGVIGEKGEGLVQTMKMESSCFARIHTFGKACGAHGSVVLGSKTLKDYLVNFARSLVYSTSLPESAIAAIVASYELFPDMKQERERLAQLISYFRSGLGTLEAIESSTAIQGIVIPGNKEVREASEALKENGLDIRPILYPTVPEGKERLRIVLHSFNAEVEIDLMLKVLNSNI